MKFLCSNCKAKYQIPDEKIAGRTLKMDCRRCSTPIVIRGDLGVPDDAEELAPEPQEPARTGPRGGAPASASASVAGARRPATAARPLGASTGGSNVGPHPTASSRTTGRGALGADFRRNVGAAAEPPRAVTPLDQWHVAINDVPVGPMKRDEISRKIAAGAVTGESLAWREGFDDWRPLREIPELAALMRRATQADSDRPPARGAPRAPAPRAPAPRPAGASTARPVSPASVRPAARSNVVAIGGRLGASAAPAIDADELADGDEPSLGDSEATTVANAADLGLADFGSFGAKDAAKAKAKPDHAPIAKAAPEAAEADPFPSAKPARSEPAKPAKPPSGAFKPIPPPASAGLGVPPKPAAVAAPAAKAETDRGSFAPPPAQAAAPLFSPPAAAPVVPVTTVAAPEKPRERALPIGALMGIGFAMAAGAVLMYAVVQRFVLAPPATETPVVATATVVPTVGGPETQHVADVDVETTPPPELPTDPVAPPTTPTETTPVADTATHHSTTSTGTGAHSATKAPTTTATTPPSTTGSSRFDQFADEGSGPAAIPVGPTEGHHTSDGPTASRTELTEAQISEVRRREQRSLQTCWETAIRGMRDVGDVRMDIDITIGASGTVTSARARGPGVGTLSECIEQRVRRWRFPASSEPTQLTFPVVFSGQ
jgi:predicted Zn finger-like uncharacterized protein